jgi:hypothetical protein
MVCPSAQVMPLTVRPSANWMSTTPPPVPVPPPEPVSSPLRRPSTHDCAVHAPATQTLPSPQGAPGQSCAWQSPWTQVQPSSQDRSTHVVSTHIPPAQTRPSGHGSPPQERGMQRDPTHTWPSPHSPLASAPTLVLPEGRTSRDQEHPDGNDCRHRLVDAHRGFSSPGRCAGPGLFHAPYDRARPRDGLLGWPWQYRRLAEESDLRHHLPHADGEKHAPGR